MSLLIIWVLFSIGAAIAASNKGRRGFGWFLLGIPLGPFALLFAILLPAIKSTPAIQEIIESETKICPQCAEAIKLAAKKCRYCGEIFSEEERENAWRKKIEDYDDPRFCPYCKKKDLIDKFLPEGGFGSWCPNCKKTIKYLKKIPSPKYDSIRRGH